MKHGLLPNPHRTSFRLLLAIVPPGNSEPTLQIPITLTSEDFADEAHVARHLSAAYQRLIADIQATQRET